MQELGLMERFADPALIDSLTIGERTAASLVTTLIGMGITFVILVLLWAVIALISGLIRKSETKASTPAQPAAAAPVAETATPQPTTVSTSSEPGQELIAVIMAAIAAGQGSEVLSKLKIQKIQRVSGARTTWNTAGSTECIESRKI